MVVLKILKATGFSPTWDTKYEGLQTDTWIINLRSRLFEDFIFTFFGFSRISRFLGPASIRVLRKFYSDSLFGRIPYSVKNESNESSRQEQKYNLERRP